MINKLLLRNQIYATATVRKDYKQIPNLRADKAMKRKDTDFQQSKNVTYCKCFDNKIVLMSAANVKGTIVTSNIYRRMKGSANKKPVLCPNIIKMYNQGIMLI